MKLTSASKSVSLLFILTWCLVACAQQPTPTSALPTTNPLLYQTNFEQTPIGKLPEDFMVRDGAWTVKEANGQKFLELPGTPLDTFEVQFGPLKAENISVSAAIYGTATGRRYPVFAVGLNGASGYKLQVAPGKRTLDLYRGDEVITNTPFAWQPGTWTLLKFQNRKLKSGEWSLQGKAWKEGTSEPAKWLLTYLEKSAPLAGRSSVSGAPISGTPIRYRNLRISSELF